MFDGLNAALGVTLVAGILLIVINAFYRFLVNQDKIGAVKTAIQSLNEKSKGATPEQQKQIMSETMAKQREMMKMNMKPMMLSLVVVVLLLPWLGGLYQDSDVALTDGVGSFVRSANGNYTLTVTNGSFVITGDGTTVNGQLPQDIILAGNTWHVSDNNGKVHFALIAAVLPDGLPLVGGWQLGWIWWYLLVSIPLAIIIRAAYGIRA